MRIFFWRKSSFWIIAHCLSVNGNHQDHYQRFEGTKREAMHALNEIINRDWGDDCVLMTASIGKEFAGTDC